MPILSVKTHFLSLSKFRYFECFDRQIKFFLIKKEDWTDWIKQESGRSFYPIRQKSLPPYSDVSKQGEKKQAHKSVLSQQTTFVKARSY